MFKSDQSGSSRLRLNLTRISLRLAGAPAGSWGQVQRPRRVRKCLGWTSCGKDLVQVCYSLASWLRELLPTRIRWKISSKDWAIQSHLRKNIHPRAAAAVIRGITKDRRRLHRLRLPPRKRAWRRRVKTTCAAHQRLRQQEAGTATLPTQFQFPASQAWSRVHSRRRQDMLMSASFRPEPRWKIRTAEEFSGRRDWRAAGAQHWRWSEIAACYRDCR